MLQSWRSYTIGLLRWLLRKLQKESDQLAEIAMSFSASQVSYLPWLVTACRGAVCNGC